MAWYSGIVNFFRQPVRGISPVMVRAMPRGRSSVDNINSFSSATWMLTAPSNYEQNWQLLNLSSKDFDQIDPSRLLEMLTQLSPEVSRAFYDFRIMCNPGYTVKAKRYNSDAQHAVGQAAVQAFIDKLNSQSHGSFDEIIDMQWAGAFVYGAMCAELVLDKRGRLPLTIATPNPSSIRFRRRTDPELGDIWQPGQWQESDFKPLDIPTFFYRSFGRMFDSPHGIPLAAPSLFTSLFLLGMLHDLRRVIQQQGYPRIDLSVDIVKMLEAAPHLAANTEQFDKWVGDLVTQVEQVYSQLQPDDAYIHTSNVSVNRPVGAVDASSLGGIDAIITALERMSVRALKTNGLLLDLSATSSESEANRKWEMYVAGIKIVQHGLETMLGRLFTLALEAQGIQAQVTFEFAELRAAEQLRDAQAETMKIANAKAKRDEGWQTQDEASIEITGSKAVGPAPVQQQANPQIVQDDNDGQQLNAMWLTELREGKAIVSDALKAINLNGYHHD